MPRVGQRVVKWTDAEDDVIAAHYPSGGAAACVTRLPGRTFQAIQNRAHHLDVRMGQEEGEHFDHRALAAALGIPARPPKLSQPATVHRCGDGA